MTKKSMSRIARDLDEKEKEGKIRDAEMEALDQIKDNKIYDDINDVYKKSGETLGRYAQSFNELCVKEAIPLMPPSQQQKVYTLVSGFKRDVETLTKDLLKINEPHKGKTGGEKSLEKFITTVGVVDQYDEFIGRAKGVLDPTFRAMAAEIISITDPIEVNEGLTPEQNPEVVTDVIVKEI